MAKKKYSWWAFDNDNEVVRVYDENDKEVETIEYSDLIESYLKDIGYKLN